MKKIALFGNPNTGKSSLFNRLTGLKQRVGNFPGVTVDKQSAVIQLNNSSFQIVDFPGTYSIYPRSKDEQVVYDVLNNPAHPDFPDLAVVVVDASNLERNLLLFTQIVDSGIPTLLAINMMDVASKNGIVINASKLQDAFPESVIVRINARIGFGMEELKNAIINHHLRKKSVKPLLKLDDAHGQALDTSERFVSIKALVDESIDSKKVTSKNGMYNKGLDRWLVHPVWGYVIFIATLLLIFQSVFSLASYPMDWIDAGFSSLAEYAGNALPEGPISGLISEGIIPGLGGVVIFIPQIALLFLLLGLLEETGYMARVVFIMDKLMRPFGLNGRSVVPLISSAACAIPGVMAARMIPSWNERLTTILVAPLMSCSARIPVYTLLIALVIPDQTIFGFFNLQGLVLFALYALGLVSALLVAMVMKFLFKTKTKSVFLLELPPYKSPRWANVGLEVIRKVKLFVFDAGKIILAISIILWFLASYGPGNQMEDAANAIPKATVQNAVAQTNYVDQVASAKLENSYIGHFGKVIEPVIAPLGYDWKIGIALITSFAAREVFVGSMATIYSVHQEDDDPAPLLERMRGEKHSDGSVVYTLGAGISLLVFYVFAMQCMATLAIVKRETKSWKWPVIQVAYMGVLAYFGAFIAFNLFQ